ncbi:MAG: S8 family serine peptidase [Candidatus Eisenbacteria bacterium]|nr:S8 family serine peptidase [Candidatus Eisenbacteria bacterium]
MMPRTIPTCVPLLIVCSLVCLSRGPATANPPADSDITEATLAYLADLGEDAAQRKVWVYFADKGAADASALEARLRATAAALEPHAVSRRRKTLGPGLVDRHDLPVCATYRRAVAACGAEIVRESRWLNAVSVRASVATLRAVAALPEVVRLLPVARGRYVGRRDARSPVDGCRRLPASRPSQSEGPLRFDYGPSYDQMAEIGIVTAHDGGWSGAGVRICLMDTGYWREHPVYARLLAEQRLIAQWDFVNDDGETQDEPGDPEGQHFHGTVTWSLVGGFEETELIGAAYGAEFLLAKTEDTADEYPAEEDNWVAAMEWADAHGADILSTSLNYIQWYTYEDMDGNTAPITIASDIAAGRGMLPCVAAGNWGTMDWYYIGAPADADSVIAVGGTMPDGTLWYDSSHGPTYDGRIKPEVCARGACVYCAVVPGGHGGPDLYRQLDGTSVACPLVAGAAALLLEAHPNWSAMQVREALMLTADNAEDPDNDRGWGRIDVAAALGYGAGVGERAFPASVLAQLRAWPNPARGRIGFRLVGDEPRDGPQTIEIFTPNGRRIVTLPWQDPTAPLRWNGVGAGGAAVPTGLYLARVRGSAAPAVRVGFVR